MRLRFLDTARALAVLYVLIFHVAGIWSLPYPKQMTQFIQSGGSGVVLFFVISGFSLCLTMQRHMESQSPRLSYATARIFRIAPLYYLLLIITIWRDAEFRDMLHEPAKVLASALLVFNLYPEYAKGIVWASWTIGVEIIFYAIFPVLYRILNNSQKRIAALIGASWATYALATFFTPHLSDEVQRSFSYMNFPRNLAIFLSGMVAFDTYVLLHRKIAANQVSWGLMITAIGASLVTSFVILARLTWGKILFVDLGLIQAFSYSVLILGLSFLPNILAGNCITDFYSRVCYSAYLWHPLVIWALKDVYDFFYALEVAIWEKFGLSVLTTLVVLSAVSWTSYHLIERPGQKMGKLLLKRWNARKSAQQAGY